MSYTTPDPYGVDPEPDRPAPRRTFRYVEDYVPAVPAAAGALGLSAFIGLFDNWLITLIALAGLVALTMGRR